MYAVRYVSDTQYKDAMDEFAPDHITQEAVRRRREEWRT
jgi:hypothetical protein